MCMNPWMQVFVHRVDCVQQQQPYICCLVPTYVHVQASCVCICLHIWLCVCMYVCINANI